MTALTKMRVGHVCLKTSGPAMTASIRGSQKTAKSCVKDAQEEEEEVWIQNLKFIIRPDHILSPFSGPVICEDKDAEGMCLPQFKWGCNRFPWFLEDCQKLCGQC